METSNVQPMIEPDPEQMRRHMAHLFEGFLDGCHEGKIELAWTDGRDGKLKHAAIFGTDELDELVARAVAENRKPRQNVYIGQALRKPDIAPFGRCNDSDFFALTAFYADIDDDVTATASINYRNRGCPPTAVIVTGRQPHVRAQMLWRLQSPERDALACRQQNLALADALGGDTTVVNASRVMRLGGSIAWPTKEGRVIERTEFLSFEDGRPKSYLAEQIAKAFPPAPALPQSSAQRAEPPTPDATTVTQLNIGSELSVETCLARIRRGDHWHNNLVRLVGHWLARGFPTSRRLRHPKRLIVLPLPDAGGSRPVITTNGKALARTPFFDDLKHQLAQLPELRLVVIDPLQAFALADVNADPAAAQFLWSAMAELAAATGASVLLTHHMRKDGMLRIADGDDAREAIRGTTALVDGSRLSYALWKLDDETARSVCDTLQVPFERGRVVRGAVVKANDEADYGTHTYKREDSGLLVQLENEPNSGSGTETAFSIAQAREVLTEIQRRFEAGTPFSHAPNSGARYLGHYLARQYRLSRKAASDLIADWMNNGVIGIDVVDRKSKLSGLRVLSWL